MTVLAPVFRCGSACMNSFLFTLVAYQCTGGEVNTDVDLESDDSSTECSEDAPLNSEAEEEMDAEEHIMNGRQGEIPERSQQDEMRRTVQKAEYDVHLANASIQKRKDRLNRINEKLKRTKRMLDEDELDSEEVEEVVTRLTVVKATPATHRDNARPEKSGSHSFPVLCLFFSCKRG